MVDSIIALNGAYPDGWTNTADAFRTARTQVFGQDGDRSDATNMAIIITDGIPTRNEEQAVPEATNLQNANVKVIAVGITQFIDANTLQSFSSSPRRENEEYFSSPDFSQLDNILLAVLENTACPSPTPTPGITIPKFMPNASFNWCWLLTQG